MYSLKESPLWYIVIQAYFNLLRCEQFWQRKNDFNILSKQPEVLILIKYLEPLPTLLLLLLIRVRVFAVKCTGTLAYDVALDLSTL